jgi:hypothetical protein
MSKFDLHNLCIAEGPDFRHAFETAVPSGNIDIAPSILGVVGFHPPGQIDGRLLDDAMIPLPDQAPALATRPTDFLRAVHGDWRQGLVITHVGGTAYFEEQ